MEEAQGQTVKSIDSNNSHGVIFFAHAFPIPVIAVGQEVLCNDMLSF